MKQLLDGKKRRIIKSENNIIEIDEDSNNYDEYIQGGIIEEVIEDIFIRNKEIEQMIYTPDIGENINPSNIELNMH